MRAGALDTQISVLKKETTRDSAYNTELITWVPLVAAAGSPVIAERWWAEVQDALPSRSEAVRQGLAQASKIVRIRLRYRNDIDATMRVTVHRDTDETFQIIAPPAMVAGRKEMIELACESLSTQGDGP